MSSRLHAEAMNHGAVKAARARSTIDIAAHKVRDALFAIGRGHNCQLVACGPPYQVTLEPSDEGSLNSVFAGVPGCPDCSALPVTGSFEILEAGE